MSNDDDRPNPSLGRIVLGRPPKDPAPDTDVAATRQAAVAFYMRRVVVTADGECALRTAQEVAPGELVLGDVMRAAAGDGAALFSVTGRHDIPGHNIDDWRFATPEQARDALLERHQLATRAGLWPD